MGSGRSYGISKNPRTGSPVLWLMTTRPSRRPSDSSTCTSSSVGWFGSYTLMQIRFRLRWRSQDQASTMWFSVGFANGPASRIRHSSTGRPAFSERRTRRYAANVSVPASCRCQNRSRTSGLSCHAWTRVQTSRASAFTCRCCSSSCSGSPGAGASIACGRRSAWNRSSAAQHMPPQRPNVSDTGMFRPSRLGATRNAFGNAQP